MSRFTAAGTDDSCTFSMTNVHNVLSTITLNVFFIIFIMMLNYRLHFCLCENMYKLPPGNNYQEANGVYSVVEASMKGGNPWLLRTICTV